MKQLEYFQANAVYEWKKKAIEPPAIPAYEVRLGGERNAKHP